MTTAAESELLTRVGPGTPMGELMREYWVPAALSSELVADGAPVRLMLLGEKLIAFRDSGGRVGVMDHRCPHRCASLFFGRNETGRIALRLSRLEVRRRRQLPRHAERAQASSLPPEDQGQGLPGVERNGLVWTYMGARAEPPPLPMIEPVLLGDGERNLFMVQRQCNWLQGLEGDIDTSHFGFLHVGAVEPEEADQTNLGRYAVINRAPEYHVADTDWGTMYAAYRPAEPSDDLLALRALPLPVLDHPARRAVPRSRRSRAPGCRWTTTTRCSCMCRGRRTRPGCAS